MKTREEAVRYGLTFPEVYRDEPFHDPNWTVIRKKKSRRSGEISGEKCIPL